MLLSSALTITFLVIGTLGKPLDVLQHRALLPRSSYNGTQPDGKFYTASGDHLMLY